MSICTQVSAILDQVKVGGVSAIPGLETQLKSSEVVRSADGYPFAAGGPFCRQYFTSYIYVQYTHCKLASMKLYRRGLLVDACTGT